jgi:hypothetical protein
MPRESLPQESLPEAEEETPLNAVKDLYADIAPAEIPKEIAGLLSATRKSKNDKESALAHLQLAWLFGHYKNPSPQYLKALQELDAYLSLDPENSGDDYLQNWYKILKEIARLNKDNKELRERTEQLKEQMQQLKHLDIEMEKRRQDIK